MPRQFINLRSKQQSARRGGERLSSLPQPHPQGSSEDGMAQQAYMTETDNGGSGPERRGDRFRRLVNRLLSGVPAILYVNHVYPDGRFHRSFLSLSAERVTGWPNKVLQRDGALAERTDPAFVAGWTAGLRNQRGRPKWAAG